MAPTYEIIVRATDGALPPMAATSTFVVVLAPIEPNDYSWPMVIIRFDDSELEKHALDFLVGRYSFKTWANGDLMLPEPALGQLAAQGLPFRVKGPATYEHFLPPLRDSAPASV